MLSFWRPGIIINVGVLIGVRVDFVIDMMIGTLARVFAGAKESVVSGVGVDLLTVLSANVLPGLIIVV